MNDKEVKKYAKEGKLDEEKALLLRTLTQDFHNLITKAMLGHLNDLEIRGIIDIWRNQVNEVLDKIAKEKAEVVFGNRDKGFG